MPRGRKREPVHEIHQTFDVSYAYRVVFSRHCFQPGNATLRELFERAGDRRHRVLPVLDSGVLQADPDLPERIRSYFDAHSDRVELISPPLVVRGGEICKTDPREVEDLYARVERDRICRQSFVLAIGGGSMLDAVGYAAANAHRGIRLIRMPTTVLAQNDAGIGVKNAINHLGRKNFVGTFAPPFAVVNDFAFLATLPPRDRRSGIAEAVKVALIKDADAFERIHANRSLLAAFVPAALEEMIIGCAELHLEHIRSSGDPFEFGAARPLDFGHWSAHRLEELSGGRLRHGEAVAIGIALDSIYSQRTGMIGADELHRILETLVELGFDLQDRALGELDIPVALSEFREHLGGDLSITLLAGLGQGVEVDSIDPELMQKSVDFLLAGGSRPRG
ncbi:MAG: 3-dehydroquinate synthase [Myxococcota bacterium]